jgi:hypothetical protein
MNNLPGLARHRELNGGRPDGWIEKRPTVARKERVAPQPIEMYAVVSTWYDGDIIQATVRNCFEQGCSRVYILDNASPDDTVEVAERAGAIIANVYHTDMYDDDYRCRLQNEIVHRTTTEEKLSNLWWLTLDADEFPVAPDGGRLPIPIY